MQEEGITLTRLHPLSLRPGRDSETSCAAHASILPFMVRPTIATSTTTRLPECATGKSPSKLERSQLVNGDSRLTMLNPNKRILRTMPRLRSKLRQPVKRTRPGYCFLCKLKCANRLADHLPSVPQLERASRHHPSDSTQGVADQPARARPAQTLSRRQRFLRWLTCRSAHHFDDHPNMAPARRPTIVPEDAASGDNGGDDPSRRDPHTYPPQNQAHPQEQQPRAPPGRHNGPMATSGLEGSPSPATRRRKAIPIQTSDLYVVSEGERKASAAFSEQTSFV